MSKPPVLRTMRRQEAPPYMRLTTLALFILYGAEAVVGVISKDWTTTMLSAGAMILAFRLLVRGL